MNERIAARVGLSPGQVWTVGLGLVLAVLLLATSVPAAYDGRSAVAPLVAAPAPAFPGAPLPSAPTGGAPLPTGEALAPLPLAPLPAASLPAAPLGLAPAPAPLPPLALPPGPVPPAQAAPPPAGPPPPASPTGPLRLRDGGWSSADPAPIATAGVPAEALVVGARAGSARETAYVRLTGLGTELVLPVLDGDGASFGVETAAVVACTIPTADWRSGRPGPAVAFDRADCVPASVADGVLRVDLSAYADRTSDRGFALVPAGDGQPAVSTFRLSLDPTGAPS